MVFRGFHELNYLRKQTFIALEHGFFTASVRIHWESIVINLNISLFWKLYHKLSRYMCMIQQMILCLHLNSEFSPSTFEFISLRISMGHIHAGDALYGIPVDELYHMRGCSEPFNSTSVSMRKVEGWNVARRLESNANFLECCGEYL